MLIAGIIPGLLLTVHVSDLRDVSGVARSSRSRPDIAANSATQPKTSAAVRCASILPCAFVFFMVMGLIMFGVATPTEAAATGVFGAIIVAVVYRRLSLRMLLIRSSSAATVSALLLIIMCSAVMFSQLLTFTGATRAVGRAGGASRLPATLMLFAMMALPFVLFMFLDQLALMLVLIPIYQPILKMYHFNQIWFWTLFLIVATVGGLTPPFGYVLFALKSARPSADHENLPCVLAVRLADRARHGHSGALSGSGHGAAQSHATAIRSSWRECHVQTDQPEISNSTAATGDYVMEDQVGFLMRVAMTTYRRFMSRMVGGLTQTQWAALAKLAEVGPVRRTISGV